MNKKLIDGILNSRRLTIKMEKREKKKLEHVAISVILLAVAITSLLLIQKAFPEDFGLITGQVTASVNITPPVPRTCNMSFQPGLNLVSFFCITTLQDRETFLENVTNYDYIFTYRSYDSVDPWKVYNPNLPTWVTNDLSDLSRTEAYWFYFDMDEPQKFYYGGTKTIPTHIILKPGWNLAGYPTDNIKEIEEALSTINDSYIIIYSFDNNNKSNFSYQHGIGSLNQTEPYNGYWINMSQADSWVINW